MRTNGTVNPRSSTASNELEREIVGAVADRLGNSFTLLLNPGDDEKVETGSGENIFRYSPDLIVSDSMSGRKIVIEIKNRISGAFTATLSRFRAIQRAVESKGNLFLLVLLDPDSEDNWLFEELDRLKIQYVDASKPAAAADKVATLASRLRQAE